LGSYVQRLLQLPRHVGTHAGCMEETSHPALKPGRADSESSDSSRDSNVVKTSRSESYRRLAACSGAGKWKLSFVHKSVIFSGTAHRAENPAQQSVRPAKPSAIPRAVQT
jgi:hypothetical protein